MNRHRVLALLFVAAFAGLLAFFALRSSAFFQPIEWLPRPIGRWADRHGVARNIVAFFAFGLAALAILGTRWTWVLALCAFGTALEVAQLWIPTRVFDWRDIAATVAGVLAAWPFAWLVRRFTVRA